MSSSKVARDICQATNQKKLVEILINLSNFVSMMLVINRGRYERSSRMA
jgi:4-hydroxy-3-methylbut-2-enyl diphosphate reductase IspH